MPRTRSPKLEVKINNLFKGQPNIPSYSTAKNPSLLGKLGCPVLQLVGGQYRCHPLETTHRSWYQPQNGQSQSSKQLQNQNYLVNDFPNFATTTVLQRHAVWRLLQRTPTSCRADCRECHRRKYAAAHLSHTHAHQARKTESRQKSCHVSRVKWHQVVSGVATGRAKSGQTGSSQCGWEGDKTIKPPSSDGHPVVHCPL
jgi:hypothetical protein